jgi:hypothetical protein
MELGENTRELKAASFNAGCYPMKKVNGKHLEWILEKL